MVPPVRSRAPRAERKSPATERVVAGRAWVRGRLQPVEIGIDSDGRICDVAKSLSGSARHDVGDRVILPAATDLHVHFREPGGDPQVETIASGTLGAALGGVGLVGDMPNTVPTVSDPERLEEKAGHVRSRAAVDVLLHAYPERIDRVAALARHAGAFKIYTSPTTGIERALGGVELTKTLEAVAATDLPVVVHAEDPSHFRSGPAANDTAGWDAARPAAAELAAVRAVLAGPERLRLHIAHATSTAVVEAVLARGVSCEATAHHLLLSRSSGAGPTWKVNPPLRDEPTRAALWAEFVAGRIPILSSDHAPHSAEEKARPFDLAPSGVPGVQTSVPLLLARVAAGELSLDALVRAACDRPARLLGQPVGRLAPGHRAHLLVVDFRERRRLRGGELRSPCGWSPFEGREVVFPQEHWRDGEPIVQAGEYVGRPNGRVVRPEFAPGAPGPATVEE